MKKTQKNAHFNGWYLRAGGKEEEKVSGLGRWGCRKIESGSDLHPFYSLKSVKLKKSIEKFALSSTQPVLMHGSE